MSELTPQEMHQALAEYGRHRRFAEQECLNAVVAWRLANDIMISPSPLHDQVDRGVRGVTPWRVPKRKWIESEQDALDVVRHGFDRAGNLRVIESMGNRYLFFDHDRWIDQHIVRRHGELDRFVKRDGVVQCHYRARIDSCTEEQFFREQGRVVRSVERAWLMEEGQFSESEFTETYSYEYDEQGRLEKVVCEVTSPDGFRRVPEVVFVRPRENNQSGVFQELEDFLVDQIPKAIRAAGISETLYCLMICYCGEDIASGWPGHLVLGSEAVRQRHLATCAPDARGLIWAPTEVGAAWKWPVPDLCEPSAQNELEERALRVRQHVGNSDVLVGQDVVGPLRQVLHRIAQRLNRIDWKPVVPVTRDFVVLAADETYEFDFDDDLEASVPKARLMLLKSRGCITPPGPLH